MKTMEMRFILLSTIGVAALGALLNADESKIFKENDILNLKIDKKFIKITESNITLITIIGSRCISVNGKNYIISN